MKAIKPLTAIILIVMLFTATVYAEKWYVGGTLHNATVQEWKHASYRNRLATCADYISSTSEGEKLEREEGVDAIKMRAMNLERCITEATEGEHEANLKVSQMAAICIVLIRHQ